MNNTINILIVIVIGLSLGSFINALVWRLHKQLNKHIKSNKYSILTGRSICPKCEHELGPIDLIPILSWALLGGKCRYCHKPIAISYPVVELLTTILFVFSYIYWPYVFNVQGIFYLAIWLILLVGLIALTIYDIQWLTLPNKIIYPLLVIVLIQILATIIFYGGGLHYVINEGIGLLIGGGIFYILFQLSQGKWIGGGDVKLGILLGLYLGSGIYALMMIFIASVLGSLYGGLLLALGKMKHKSLIPYGPFLIVATIIIALSGTSILSWLKSIGIYI